MNGIDWSLLFDEALLFVIATFYLLTWLVLRRRTTLGRALARSNLALAVAYYGAVLAMHFILFRHPVWRWSVRVVVAITAAHAIWELVGFFGGWRATVREMGLSLREIRDSWGEAGCVLAWRARRRWRWLRGWITRTHRSESDEGY